MSDFLTPDMNIQNETDKLLRRTMTAPIPTLSPGFDQRLMREVRGESQPLDTYRRILFTGYGLASVIASTVVLHGQGLGWGIVAATTLAPIAFLAIARPMLQTRRNASH